MPLADGTTPQSLLQHLRHRLRCLQKARYVRQRDMAIPGLRSPYDQGLAWSQVHLTLLTLYTVAAALEVSEPELSRPEPDHALANASLFACYATDALALTVRAKVPISVTDRALVYARPSPSPQTRDAGKACRSGVRG